MQEDKRLPNIPVTGPFEALAYAAPALGLVTIIAGNWGSGSWRHLVHQCNMAPWLASVHEVHFAHPDPDMVMGQFEQDQWELRRIVAAEMDRVAREDGVKQARLALEKMAPMQISSHARSGQDCLSLSYAIPVTVLDPKITALKYVEMVAATRPYNQEYQLQLSFARHSRFPVPAEAVPSPN